MEKSSWRDHQMVRENGGVMEVGPDSPVMCKCLHFSLGAFVQTEYGSTDASTRWWFLCSHEVLALQRNVIQRQRELTVPSYATRVVVERINPAGAFSWTGGWNGCYRLFFIIRFKTCRPVS